MWSVNMYRELLASLTADQVKALGAHGIPQPRVSEWKHGKGFPTVTGICALAEVTGADLADLTRAVAELQANDAQRSLFRRAVTTASVGAIALGLMAPASEAQAAPSSAAAAGDRLYIMSTVRRWLRTLLGAPGSRGNRQSLRVAIA
jgi:hypothetical protein